MNTDDTMKKGWFHPRSSAFILVTFSLLLISPAFAEDNRSLFEKGEKFFKEKNYKEAKRVLNQVVAKASPLEDYIPKARLLLADLQEDFNVSIMQFKSLAAEYAKSPEGEEAQKSLGSRYFLADKYEEAVAAYKEFLQDYPKSLATPEVLYWYGASLMALGKNQEALDPFKKAVERSPDSAWAPKALLGMATVCLRLNRPQDAIKHLLRILDQYRYYEELNLVYLKLGQAYEAAKKPEQAYAAYRTLVQDYPKSFEVNEANIRMQNLERVDPRLASAAPVPTPTPAPEATPVPTRAPLPLPPEEVEGLAPTPTQAVEAALPTATPEPLEPAKPFHVQVGVFSKMANAQKLKDELREAGYEPFTVRVQDADMAYPLYKVRVGAFEDRPAAEKLAREITAKRKEKAFVVED